MKLLTIKIPSTPIFETLKNSNESKLRLEKKRKEEEKKLMSTLFQTLEQVRQGLNEAVGEELWKTDGKYGVKKINNVMYTYISIYFSSYRRNTTDEEYELIFAVPSKGDYRNGMENLSTLYHYIDNIEEVKIFLLDDSKSRTYHNEMVVRELQDLKDIHNLVEEGYKKYLKYN